MSRSLNVLRAALSIGAVGFTLAMPADAFAQLPSTPPVPAVPVKVTNAATVTVVNGAGNPVPVTGTVQLAGTPTVALAGTPTVALAGTPSVAIAGTPTVAIAGTPAVAIANLPGAGTLYYEVLGVQINVNGAVAGTPGQVVPSGRRRIVTTVSARWACTGGHGALVQIFGNTGLFLPGQRAYTDSLGRDTYAMVSQVNISQGPGTQWVPIIESDGSECLADIFVSGVEIPDVP